jgi:hypothetical protein
MKSLIGLSTSSSLGEILSETTDKQVARLAAQSIARHTSFPKTQRYVWELPAGTELPDNVHLSRDKQWEEDMDVPSGHHSPNSTYGDEGGQIFVDRLREIRWKQTWHWLITYEEIIVEGKRRIRRSIVGGEGYEDEMVEEMFQFDLE